MTKKQSKVWEVRLNILKRQEAVDNFCDACVGLAPRDRRKVERILKRHADRETDTKSNYREPWTKSQMRACYHELRDISPIVAKAWRLWALELLKTAPFDFYGCLAFIVLVDSLDCRMWIEKPSDGSA